MNYMSDNVNELFTALAKAQGEMSSAAKDCKGYNYKYADLASVWGACREPLSRNGLTITQIESHNELGQVLITVLGHSSGQWMRSIMPIRVKPTGSKNELQDLGSVLTYLRRYSLSAIVGIAPAEDDDGQAGKSYQAKPDVSFTAPAPLISKEQSDDLRNILQKCTPDLRANVNDELRKRGIQNFVNMSPKLYSSIMKAIERDLQEQKTESAETVAI